LPGKDFRGTDPFFQPGNKLPGYFQSSMQD